MSDISLLPEGLRRSEQAVQKQAPETPPVTAGGLKMHIPAGTADEDIEIIEVDESDLGAILADEPLFTRLSYQLSSALDTVRQKLFASKDAAPPPKLPPQFFTPPKSGLVTKAVPGVPGEGVSGADASVPRRPGVRITPSVETPRRVRVIRRVRKPVQITLLSPEEMLAYRADVPRRKWTLAVCVVLFAAVLGGGYWQLSARVADAKGKADGLASDLTDVRREIVAKETEWNKYRDLQKRLTTLDGILNQHAITSRVFDFLEAWTSPDVSYQSATWDPLGTLSLDVTAASYAAAARQLVAFQRSPLVTEATAMSFAGTDLDPNAQPAPAAPAGGSTAGSAVASAPSGVSFQLLLTLDPAAFRGPAVHPGLTPSPVTTSTTPNPSATQNGLTVPVPPSTP